MNDKTEQIWDDVWQTGASGSLITWLRYQYNWCLGRVLARHSTADSRLLELGCGTAQLSLLMARRVKGVVGLDISSEGLAIATRERDRLGIKNVSFVKGDCRNVPFKEEFDVVWSAGLIEHFFDKDIEIVRQHLQAVKKGGVAVMSVPYAYSLHSLHYLVSRPAPLRWLWPWSQERYFQKFYSRRQLTDVGERLGLPYAVSFLPPTIVGLLLGVIVIEIKKA